MTAATAVVLAAAAVWLLVTPTDGPVRLRRTVAVEQKHATWSGFEQGAGERAHPPVAALAGGVFAAAALAGVAGVLLLALAAPPLVAARRWRATARARAAVRAAVPGACRLAAAQLRAGATPAAAIRAAADGAPPQLALALRRAAATADLGGDVAAALAGGPPGSTGLAWLAACWRVAEEAGSGLAAAVDRVAAALDAQERHRRDVASQLAGARASAAVLGALPLAGLALGAGLGGRPLSFLTTPLGLGCLGLAAVLDLLGVLWVHHLARAAGA